jgi:hypothetical protein
MCSTYPLPNDGSKNHLAVMGSTESVAGEGPTKHTTRRNGIQDINSPLTTKPSYGRPVLRLALQVEGRSRDIRNLRACQRI